VAAALGARVVPEYSSQTDGHTPFVRPTLRIWYGEQGEINIRTEEPVLEYEGLGAVGAYNMTTLLQIVELDGSNDAPEVLSSEYTGGMHCCAVVTVFSQDSEDRWQPVKVGESWWQMGSPIRSGR